MKSFEDTFGDGADDYERRVIARSINPRSVYTPPLWRLVWWNLNRKAAPPGWFRK